ncbi:hypothetical protein ACFL2U_03755 [Patescibacteria group bacterium]
MDLAKITPAEKEKAEKFDKWWRDGPLTSEEKKMLGAKYFSFDFEVYGIPKEVVKGNSLDIEIEEFTPLESGKKKW